MAGSITGGPVEAILKAAQSGQTPEPVALDRDTFQALQEELLDLARSDPETAALVVTRLRTFPIDWSATGIMHANHGNGYAVLIDEGNGDNPSVLDILRSKLPADQVPPPPMRAR